MEVYTITIEFAILPRSTWYDRNYYTAYFGQSLGCGKRQECGKWQYFQVRISARSELLTATVYLRDVAIPGTL
jgi:hypothetical protein